MSKDFVIRINSEEGYPLPHLQTTGRWKIVTYEGSEPILYVECYYFFTFRESKKFKLKLFGIIPYTRTKEIRKEEARYTWVHEDNITVYSYEEEIFNCNMENRDE